jgi:hypothetical protein
MGLVRQLASDGLFSERLEHIGPDPDRNHLLGDATDGRAAHAPGRPQFCIGEFRDVGEIDITVPRLVRRAASRRTGVRGGSLAVR